MEDTLDPQEPPIITVRRTRTAIGSARRRRRQGIARRSCWRLTSTGSTRMCSGSGLGVVDLKLAIPRLDGHEIDFATIERGQPAATSDSPKMRPAKFPSPSGSIVSP